MKKRNICLASLAAAMILSSGIGSAWAYFTTYAEARGGYAIELGDRTEIREEFNSWTKHITVSNEEGAAPVYVRARAFCGSAYELIYSDENGKWVPGTDGFYYYSDIVNSGDSTEELLVKIENVPADITDSFAFNVVVVYESTPVRYDADGSPYADWSVILDSGNTAQGEEGGAEE